MEEIFYLGLDGQFIPTSVIPFYSAELIDLDIIEGSKYKEKLIFNKDSNTYRLITNGNDFLSTNLQSWYKF